MTNDEERWWLAPPGGTPEGPFTLAELRARRESAPADIDWQVCPEGSTAWRSIADLPGFGGPTAPTTAPPGGSPPAGPASADRKTFLLLLHLTQFANFVVPMAGYIAPLVIWLAKKDDDDLIDRQGREVVNWLIFELIALVVFVVLSYLIIGIPCLLALIIMGVVLPIIGAVKASNGEFYRYPMPFRVLG